MDGFEILEGYEAVRDYLDDVQRIGDDNRNALGFFPRTVYEQFARAGCLYVVTKRTGSSPSYAGHLAFSCNFPRAHVRQIFALQQHRRKGLATLLLEKLRTSLVSQGFTSIYARVAEDLSESNVFWEREGFYVQRIEEGGATRNRRIVVRAHELPAPQLFPTSGISGDNPLQLPLAAASDTPVFLIDLNVLFDVMPRRPRHNEAANLFRAERVNSCRLAISNETRDELRRTAHPGRTDPMAAYIETFPSFPLSQDRRTDSSITELASAVFPGNAQLSDRDKSDLRHLATVIDHRLAGFITNDEAILRAGPEIERRHGIIVTSPAAFSVTATAAPEVSSFEVSPIATISFAPVRNDDEPSIRAFLSKLSLSGSAIASLWLSAGAPETTPKLAAWKDGQAFGYLTWTGSTPGSETIIARLAIDETRSEASGAARVLLMQLMEQLRPMAPRHVQLELPPHQSVVRETAARMGFFGSPGGQLLGKLLLGKVVTPKNWERTRQMLATKARLKLPEQMPAYRASGQHIELLTPAGNKTHISLDALETLLGPALFCLPDRPAIITPIQRRYSEALIGHGNQRSLLPSGTAATHYERQYVSDARTLKHFTRGALMFFYESSREGGRSELIAVGRVRQAFLKLKPELASNLEQSVLSIDTLDDIGSSSVKAVTVFDHIFHLSKPIPLAALRRLGCGRPNDLITTHPLSNDQTSKILAEAFPDG